MSEIKAHETEILGCSTNINRVLLLIKKIAQGDQNVLIYGETGTGKNLTAKKIHELSRKRNQPFLTINCANIPEELFEAELFGYGKGAYTGAVKEKKGLLETAGEGVVFLDEIGELPVRLQAKMLQTIENREFRRVGETRSRKIGVRFIFATNKNLQDEVARGQFRKDLYYRINVVSVRLPPLRYRKDDIPLLVDTFLKRKRLAEVRNGVRPISTGAMKKLMVYDYPGNVRELENIIARAALLKEGKIIRAEDIKFDQATDDYRKRTEITPRRLQEALERCRWNKTLAAQEIGKSRRQFYRLLKKFELD
ncbi:MAG: sigma-54 dependent transcriptional regulator [Candidatus Aminicenantes bacterium]|jgi:two-component system NtrC family response regulator